MKTIRKTLFLISILNFMITSAQSQHSKLDSAVFAIFSGKKSQFNIDSIPKDQELEMKITACNGTAFFISPDTFITAHHVINSHFYKENKYVLINNNSNYFEDFEIIKEFPEYDITVCKTKDWSSESYFDQYTGEIKDSQKFVSVGFDKTLHEPFWFKVIFSNGKLYILDHQKLKLEEIEMEKLMTQHFEQMNSVDSNPIQLRNMYAYILKGTLPVGFSGGPSIDINSNQVIGICSMQSILGNRQTKEEINTMIIIPITYISE